jgi:hypothetical protein
MLTCATDFADEKTLAADFFPLRHPACVEYSSDE